MHRPNTLTFITSLATKGVEESFKSNFYLQNFNANANVFVVNDDFFPFFHFGMDEFE